MVIETVIVTVTATEVIEILENLPLTATVPVIGKSNRNSTHKSNRNC